MYLVTLYTLYFVSIVAGVYGLVNHAYIRKSYFWISIFLLSSGIFQIISFLLARVFQNNLWFHYIIIPIYYLILYLVFSNFTKNKRTLRVNNGLFIIGGFMILVFDAIAINKGTIAVEAITVSNLVFSIASMVYFLDMLRISSLQSPFKTGKVYALTGILFYHSAIIFYWVAKTLVESMETNADVNHYISTEYVNHFMLIVYYVILLVALVVEKRDPIKDEY